MAREITLIGKNSDKVVLVDVRDFRKYGHQTWGLHGKGYVGKTVKKKTIYLHRLIVDCPPNKQVDHINGNKLDNRRKNLRICNNSENNTRKPVMLGKESSQYKGVFEYRGRIYFQFQNQGIKIKGYGFKTHYEAHQEYQRIRRLYLDF